MPHTHWDREWYLPFQAFRMGLVEMLDEFLPRLETDPDYDRFLLDGQMAVVDDYLEMRPDALDQLQRLAAAGRVTVGPWYILMDEFLVSGETMIRNLQLGLRRAEALGGAMSVGYLPDMFGHVGQMPQLLRLAGFEHAVVWRGVPAAVDRSAFWWRAPDGSTVRAEYLLGGYGSGAAIPAGAAALVRRVSAYEQEAGSFALTPDAPLLWMNGTDHHAPQPWLGRVLTEANASQDRYHFAVSSLPEYLAKAPTDGLPVWPGELRSGARANLLMGVASNRVDVKIAAARAERALERVAEPLCALWLPAGTWPVAELAQAWTQVIRNSAHDSICACSHDRVGAAVLHRYDEALTIAEALRGRALAAAAAVLPKGLVVLNPSGRARSGVIEMVVPGDAAVPGAQVLDQVAPGVLELAGTGAMLAHLLSRLEAADFRPDHASHISLVEGETGIDLSLTIEPQRRPDLANESILSEAGALAGAQSDRPLRIRAERAGWQRVAVHVSDVPGFGWASWHPEPLTVAPVTITLGKGPAGSTTEPAAPKTGSAQDLTPFATPINVVGATGSTTANAATIGNGVIDVAVDPEDGTWSIARPGQSALPALQGLGRLVDDGDGGDTYNYSPPQVDTVVDQPDSVAVEIIEAGPVRGIVRVIRRYRWPDRLVGGARLGQRVVEVATDLELRAGEDVLRVTTSFDNQCRDHRLRAWFPLPAATTRSRAECAFATVERGLEAEGGPGEYGLPTFPSRRFVSAGASPCCTRACWSTNWWRAVRRSPSPCCGRRACCPAPSWPTATTQPVRPCPSRVPRCGARSPFATPSTSKRRQARGLLEVPTARGQRATSTCRQVRYLLDVPTSKRQRT